MGSVFFIYTAVSNYYEKLIIKIWLLIDFLNLICYNICGVLSLVVNGTTIPFLDTFVIITITYYFVKKK